MAFSRTDHLERQGRSLVERLAGTWHASGGLCRCPAHEDRTPSLSVRVGTVQLLFHCFAGCRPEHIIKALAAQGLLAPGFPPASGDVKRFDTRGAGTNRQAAQRLWAASQPLGSSAGHTYLQRRGLSLTPADLRFHPRTPLGGSRNVRFLPALLAAVRGTAGLLAVHRTFLDPGTSFLGGITDPKRALGRLGDGAVRLAMPKEGVLGWAEGIETALAAMELTGIPCWAVLGTERFSRAALPAGVDRLILFLDNDDGGRRAETLARAALQARPTAIEARRPGRPGADWNDIWLERAAVEVLRGPEERRRRA